MTEAEQFVRDMGLYFEATHDFDHAGPKPAGSAHAPLTPPVHSLHMQDSVLPFFPGYAQKQTPPFANGRPRFYVPSPEASEAEFAQASQWYVFLGAVLSPQLLSMARKGIVTVYDPCRARMNDLLQQIPLPLLARKNLFFFAGDPDALSEPLRYHIPAAFTDFGTPLFFAHEEVSGAYIKNIKRCLEIIYYHYQLYPYEGRLSVPLRPVAGGFTLSQQIHLLENLASFARQSTVEALRGQCQGMPALLVAAASSLEAQIPHIKHLHQQCVLICANKACPLLLRHDIIPDFVVLQDSSNASAQEMEALPLPPEVGLVSHILAGAQRGDCARIYYFGHELEQLGLPANAAGHGGSVLNYQFHLADILGCTHVVLAGVSLCAEASWGLGYTPQAHTSEIANGMWTCPVQLACGEENRYYTNLNFLDVALWLRAYIQQKQLCVVNMTKESLLFGPGIDYDAAPHINSPDLPRPLFASCVPPGPEALRLAAAAQQHYARYWQWVEEQTTKLRQSSAVTLLQEFPPFLAQMDANGTTKLLETAPAYLPHAHDFTARFFHGSPTEQETAARIWLQHLHSIANTLLKILRSKDVPSATCQET